MNKKLLKNIRNQKKPFSLHCNSGMKTKNRLVTSHDMEWSGYVMAVLPTYCLGAMWRKYWVPSDSATNDSFEVHKEVNTKFEYMP